MFALEGKMRPNYREQDGPFGESFGYYITTQSPVIDIHTVSHQKSPIYPIFLPWSKEDDFLLSFLFKPFFTKVFRQSIPDIVDIKFYLPLCLVIFSIQKKREKDGKEALIKALKLFPYIKYAIVVDEDINVNNSEEVAWAVYGRFQADEDLVILEDLPGQPLDPSTKEGFKSTKVGIDATKPIRTGMKFERIDVPEEVKKKILKYLKTDK
jgi:2,5-furandicarboxylate decarboxylase 1